MKSNLNSPMIAIVVSMLCMAQSAFAVPGTSPVPEAGATSLGLLAFALAGLGLVKILKKK